MTRTPAPGAPVSTSQRQLEADLAATGTKRFVTSLAERQAYKAIFNERLALEELRTFKVGNLDGAIVNATQLVNELMQTLTEIGTPEVVA